MHLQVVQQKLQFRIGRHEAVVQAVVGHQFAQRSFAIGHTLCDARIQESTRPENRIIIALTAVLLAPLVEELLFRGVVFTALLQYLPRFWAFALSSLFFGLVHFNAVSLLPLSILAALFAWSYEKTGNLWVPILAHSLFNVINLGLMLWLPLWMETPSP